MVNLAGSGGAASLKDETDVSGGESVFSETEGATGPRSLRKQRSSASHSDGGAGATLSESDELTHAGMLASQPLDR